MAENAQEVNPQGGEDKISKQFDANFRKLVAIMGGTKNLKKVSVPSGDVGTIVDELLKERRDDKIKEFKVKAKEILEKKLDFDKNVRKAEEELKNTVNAKKKEFTEEMQKLFSFVDDIGAVEKSYYQSLKDIAPEEETSAPTA
jgi:hypothetical protein